MNDLILAYFYAFLWSITLFIYQRRRKVFDAGSIIISSYLFYAFLSIIILNDPFFKTFFKELKLFPYLYLYIGLLIFAIPIFRYSSSDINRINPPDKYAFLIVVYIFIFSTLLSTVENLSNIRDGISSLIFDSDSAQYIYIQKSIEFSKDKSDQISSFTSIISNALLYPNILFLLYSFIGKKEKKNKFIQICLIISILLKSLQSLSTGLRGETASIILCTLITYLILSKFYSKGIRQKFRKLGIVLGSVLVIPFVFLTIGRFSNRDQGSLLNYVAYYAGEQSLYFNNYGLDDGDIRDGDRTTGIFKMILGFEDVPKNYLESRKKHTNLTINDEVFVSHIGDFTIDFGPVLGAVIIILSTIFACMITKTRGHTISFQKIIILQAVGIICMQGGLSLYPFSYIGGIKLIVIFLLYITFGLFDSSSRKKQKYRLSYGKIHSPISSSISSNSRK